MLCPMETRTMSDISLDVDLGDGAKMTVPLELEWHLRYGNPEAVRFIAASVVASLSYLLLECTKEEAWRRIKLCRAEIAKMPT